MHDTTIWWIRRDLRLSDNEALTTALAKSRRVIPAFILDPALLEGANASRKRNAFLLGGLSALDEDLRRRGSRLIVRRGRPLEALRDLMTETGATAIFAEEDFSPYARKRDGEIAGALPLHSAGSSAIRPPALVMKPDGTPYTVFTPFSRAWLAGGLPDPAELRVAPTRLPDPGPWPTESLSGASGLVENIGETPFPPGEHEACRRLDQFIDRHVEAYADLRHRMDVDGTSQLSPYIRFGMISARAAAAALVERSGLSMSAGQAAWLNELIWRDFYIHILYHFPHVSRESFRQNLRDIRWRNDPDEFEAWRLGQTGFPVVDAAMRQLSQTGWMHNRARMIVASFLVKDLLIDWRWGEHWFMKQLVDGDPAANNGGWQWTAGTGTDAAPYFRIFNPTTQGEKFDPEGTYVRRWVPELANVPPALLHEPWRMSPTEQRAAGCVIGRDYPAPLIDRALTRDRTLAAYAAAKESHA